MVFQAVGVIGAGTMGHGIAHVSALAGYPVVLLDTDADRVEAGLRKLRGNLDKGVEKGKLDAAARDAAVARLSGATELAALAGCDLVVEAVPEVLSLKQELLGRAEAVVGPEAVLATNTSSLSVGRIAGALADPRRVVGLHFFNPVHLMTLLEVVLHAGTAPEVRERCGAFGVELGKECIFVQDSPGFATSRLGVCLGMEAIRMVEQGVASAEDIDKAMVLGYRHPVGPLRLTDLVGLDVRLKIGEYLAHELGNAAFEPPRLMREMVDAGKLGQKSGQGFYRWDKS